MSLEYPEAALYIYIHTHTHIHIYVCITKYTYIYITFYAAFEHVMVSEISQ